MERGRRGHDRGRSGGSCSHDRARPGDGLRDERRQARSRSRASARATARTSCSSSRSATRRIGKVRSAKSFFTAFGRSPYTFNVAYADDRDIAMYSAGRLPHARPPRRPAAAHQGHGPVRVEGLPVGATTTRSRRTRSTGQLVNWNNRPAPGWGAADNNWGYGSTHRVALLDARHRPQRDSTTSRRSSSAMNAAATQDLRSFALTPTLTALLKGTTPPSARARQMLDLLEVWRASGSSRLDRDLDGKQDAGPGPVIMDALYPQAARRGPRAGARAGARRARGARRPHERPLERVHRRRHRLPRQGPAHAAGHAVPRSVRDEVLRRGRPRGLPRRLWSAVEAAGAQIAAAQGTPDPAAWTSDATAERIRFAPGLLPTTIRYTNRPSGIQQVMSFGGHRSR